MVRSTDLDFLKHANNVELIRIASSPLSAKEYDEVRVKGLRAVYKAQAREGDELSVKKLYYPGARKIVLARGEEICDEFTFFTEG